MPIWQVYTILHEFIIIHYDNDIVWNVWMFLSPYVGSAIPVFPSCVFDSCAGRFTIFAMSQRPFEVWRVRLCGWPGRREWREWREWRCQWQWCCLAAFVGRMLWGCEVFGLVLYPKSRLRDGMRCLTVWPDKFRYLNLSKCICKHSMYCGMLLCFRGVSVMSVWVLNLWQWTVWCCIGRV